MDGARRERVEARLAAWFADRLAADAPNLVRLRDALAQETLDGGSRGILFQAIENLGSVAFGAVSNMVKDLSDEQRRALGQLGLRFGTENIYLGDMLKPRAIAMRARLWAAHAGNGYPPLPEGRVSVDRDPTIPVEFTARLATPASAASGAHRYAGARRRRHPPRGARGAFKVNEDCRCWVPPMRKWRYSGLGYRKNSAEDDGTPVFKSAANSAPAASRADGGFGRGHGPNQCRGAAGRWRGDRHRQRRRAAR